MDVAIFCRRLARGSEARGLSYLQLCYDMVIDNYGPRQVERLHRLRHGLAMQGLRSALQRYAEIAEWVRPVGSASSLPAATRGARPQAAARRVA
jgi:hypothetical protein